MGFLNTSALFGLILAGLPIAIHLLHRHRFRPVAWAAMGFVVQAIQRHHKRIRFRDMILMTIRTLAIALLALALARPTVAGRYDFLSSHTKRAAVILLDNSLSTAYRMGRESRFETGKRLARSVLAQLNRDTWCALYTFSESVHAPLGDASRDLSYLEREIDRSIYVTDEQTRLTPALTKVLELFDQHREFSGAEKEVYLITDMQAAPWRKAPNPALLSSKLEALASRSAVFVLDTGDPGIENTAVIDLRCSDELVTTGMTVNLLATIRNFSTTKVSGIYVDYLVDASSRSRSGVRRRTTVDLEPGETETLQLETAFDSGGDHRIEVRLSEDRLSLDDKRYLSMEVLDQIQVLLVEGGQPTNMDPLFGEAGFLEVALSPSDPEGRDGGLNSPGLPVRTTMIPAERLSETDLSTYQVVVLCNIGTLTEKIAQALARQVRSGLGLLIFLGDQTTRDQYNQLFGEKGVALLPARIMAPWGTYTGTGKVNTEAFKQPAVDPSRLSHQMAHFFNQESSRALLSGIQVYRAFGWAPVGAPGSSTILWVSDDTPLVKERSVGLGRVIVFPFPATSVDFGGWSNLPTQYAFPILMNRAAIRLALGHRPPKNLLTGSSLSGYVDPADLRVPIRISAPSPIGDRVIFSGMAPDGRARFDFGMLASESTSVAGFYEVQLDRAGAVPQTYSLNPPAQTESDLRRITPQEIKTLFPEFNFTHVAKSEDFANVLTTHRQGIEIWPLAIILVWILLFSESILAYVWAPRDTDTI